MYIILVHILLFYFKTCYVNELLNNNNNNNNKKIDSYIYIYIYKHNLHV